MDFFKLQFCFLLAFISLLGYGQVSIQKTCYNTETNQVDTIRYALDTISDDQYYDCVVHRKWKLRNGFLFLMAIEKSTNPCLIYVLAPNKQSSSKKLKENDCLRACFRSYNVALTGIHHSNGAVFKILCWGIRPCISLLRQCLKKEILYLSRIRLMHFIQ